MFSSKKRFNSNVPIALSNAAWAIASESTRSLLLLRALSSPPPPPNDENNDPPLPPSVSSDSPPLPCSDALYIGASAKFAKGDPNSISTITPTETTNGTYCLHDSTLPSSERRRDDVIVDMVVESCC